MATLEEIGTDARTADGYVVVWSHDATHDGIIAVAAILPKTAALARLKRAVSPLVCGYKADARTVRGCTPTVNEIAFAIPKGNDNMIKFFLECLKQCRIITNPIVSDVREFLK